MVTCFLALQSATLLQQCNVFYVVWGYFISLMLIFLQFLEPSRGFTLQTDSIVLDRLICPSQSWTSRFYSSMISDLLQSGQEAQGQWCCWRMCSWSSSKQNTFTTDRTWGKLACATEWTHLNTGDTQNSSAWQSDGSNCASYWFHAISRYLDMACCFITPSDGKSSDTCNGRN